MKKNFVNSVLNKMGLKKQQNKKCNYNSESKWKENREYDISNEDISKAAKGWTKLFMEALQRGPMKPVPGLEQALEEFFCQALNIGKISKATIPEEYIKGMMLDLEVSMLAEMLYRSDSSNGTFLTPEVLRGEVDYWLYRKPDNNASDEENIV